MKIRCVGELPTAEQAQKLGKYFRPGRQVFPIGVGEEYLVFGLSFRGCQLWAEIATEFDQLIFVPLLLFQISQPRIPSAWEIHVEDEYASLLPQQLHEPLFNDLLAQGDLHARAAFRAVRDLLEHEELSQD